jgi:hypothetical protein
MTMRVFVLLALAALVGASAASAHTIGPAGGRVYQQDNLCVTNLMQLSHGNGGGRIDASSEIDKGLTIGVGSLGYTLQCGQSRAMDPGYIAYRAIYYVWGAYSTAWSVCQDTGWLYNGSRVSYVSYSADQSSYYGGWHAPCGDGYYDPYWGAWAYDGGWQPISSGAWVSPGYHWFTYFN